MEQLREQELCPSIILDKAPPDSRLIC